jgi:hypothetical protein
MTEEEHRERHKLLHRMLDELCADWITYTDKLASTATVLELIRWSARQIDAPDHPWTKS